ncbi:hypothetical protein [Streptomyces sp. AJS327]|uniref:hypothetical protein n=1 Tax=Streptomyces sp. AJS327 TaxID=2545265 RepID=UPI0035B5196A
MIVTLIIICEVGFWVLLVLGLALRYLARMPRAGVAVLLCEPLLEVVLLAVTAIDLKNGAEPAFQHGLAAVYLGGTIAYGHYMIRWADGHAAHRLAGGPRPAKPPRYGMARALHEWKMSLRACAGAVIAAGLLQAAIWYVGDPAQTGPLRDWQTKTGFVIVISLLVALAYTVFPKRPSSRDTPDQPTGPGSPPALRRGGLAALRDRAGADRAGADGVGIDRAGADGVGADRAGVANGSGGGTAVDPAKRL